MLSLFFFSSKASHLGQSSWDHRNLQPASYCARTCKSGASGLKFSLWYVFFVHTFKSHIKFFTEKNWISSFSRIMLQYWTYIWPQQQPSGAELQALPSASYIWSHKAGTSLQSSSTPHSSMLAAAWLKAIECMFILGPNGYPWSRIQSVFFHKLSYVDLGVLTCHETWTKATFVH